VNYGPIIFLAAFFALASSWFGFVLAPQVQVGRLEQTNTLVLSLTYPTSRPGLARQGLDVYRANGCAACHTQQVIQTNTVCEVTMTDAGTNQARVLALLLSEKLAGSEDDAKKLLGDLPKTVLRDAMPEHADDTVKALTAAGAKAYRENVALGPDIARGWGKRQSVADDFLYDYPVMLGSQRIGPDLAGVGARLSDESWHLRHLYAPRTVVPGSQMPPYRFLFEKRRIEHAASAEALVVEGDYEIIPTAEARALAAYLTSLRADAPLFVAPLTVRPTTASPATNAPAEGASTNAAASTNSSPTTTQAGSTNVAPK